ncbi:hypothetical protein AB0H88_33280 [Nonomuraea sp. NPDC050680]|uniref:hypothetical protein n=1 Tax=Nonomuraea sp. NPDC050680 TaxID=3154630 RepID=UPI0033C08D55
MSGRLERCYRLLLRLYPKDYRDEHGEELIGTLILASGRFPVREMSALVAGAFTARALQARTTRVPWWADGLHLGVFVLTVFELSGAPDPLHRPMWWAEAITLLVLTARGWVRLALPLSLVVFRVLPDGWTPTIRTCVIIAGLAVLSIWPGKGLAKRSWAWLLIPAFWWLAPGGSFGLYSGLPWVLLKLGVEALLLVWAIWATMAARDARWALASAIYVWTGLALFQFGARGLAWHSTRDFLYWGGSSLLVLISLAMARRSKRVI